MWETMEAGGVKLQLPVFQFQVKFSRIKQKNREIERRSQNKCTVSQLGSKTVNKANRNETLVVFVKESKRKMFNLFLSQFFVCLLLCMHASLNVLLNNRKAFVFLPSFYHNYTIVFLPFPSSVKVLSPFFSSSLLRTVLLHLCLALISSASYILV